MKAKRRVRLLPPSVSLRNREELERKLLEGLASPSTEMTKADWKELQDRIRARAKRA